MKRRQFIEALACSIYAPFAQPGQRIIGNPYAGRSAVYGSRGALACSQPLASQAGLAILHDGGTAADAAIAMMAVLSVCEPMMSGPGGDAFAQVYDPSLKKVVTLDAAGLASQRAQPHLLRQKYASDAAMPALGPDTVTVPGAVAGWLALHRRYGRLPLKTVFASAIYYARYGFPVGPQTAIDWQFAQRVEKSMVKNGLNADEFRRVFLPAGRSPKEGEIFRNQDLAHTYERLALEGETAFYSTDIASKLIAALQESELSLQQKDLAHMKPTWGSPLTTCYRDVEFCQLPPPGQGITMLHIMALLREFDLAKLAFDSVERNHRVMEAIKIAYRDRAFAIADPEFATSLPDLLDEQRLSHQRRQLNVSRASTFSVPSALEKGDTSYLCVADRNGLIVSLISSVSAAFGSGIVPKGSGFCLQNRASGFTLERGHANEIQPGKKPFHTIIPGFAMRQGHPFMAFGVMGGAMQPQGQAQVMINLLDHGMDLQQAGDAPRLRLYGGPQPNGNSSAGLWRVEQGFSAKTLQGLGALGHQLEVGYPTPTVRYGGYQAIRCHRHSGQGLIYEAATELRQDGVALAY